MTSFKTGIAEIGISEKETDLLINIAGIVIIGIIAYLLYLASLPKKYLYDVQKDITEAAGRTQEDYNTFYNEIPLVPRIAVETGNVLSDIGEKTIGYDIVEEAAKQGKDYGIDLNTCRGTLSISQTAEYNKLTEEQRTAYNIWSCNYNKSKNINTFTFHYAPDISLWIKETGGNSASVIDVLVSYYGNSIFGL